MKWFLYFSETITDLPMLFSPPDIPASIFEIKESPLPWQPIASLHCNTRGHPEACTQTLYKDPPDESALAESPFQTAQRRRKRSFDHPWQQ